MTVFTDFLSNPSQVAQYSNWLAELYIEDSDGNQVVPTAPNNGSNPQAVGLRVSSRIDQGFRTLPTDTVSSEIYYDRLVEGLELEASIWGKSASSNIDRVSNVSRGSDVNNNNNDLASKVTVGGSSLPTVANLILDNRDGYYDQFRPSLGYLWDGRSCIVRFGSGWGEQSHESYMSIDDFRPFYFQMGEPSYSLSQVVVPIYGLDRRFDHPLTKLFYRGTGYCLNFASGAYGNVGTPAKLDITGDLTIEFWANVDNLSAARNVCGWGLGSTRHPFQLFITAGGGVRFAYFHSTGTFQTHTTTTTISTNKWYHISVSISGTSITIKIYDAITGLETSETFTQAAASRDSNLGGTFQISLNSGTTSMVGRLDELRIWSEARTAAQIRSGRYGELEFIPTALKGYYRLNDASGSTAVDEGDGTAADATLNGTTTWYPSLTGDTSLAGVLKPDAWGRPEYHEPVLVDPVNLIYQVAGAGSVQRIIVTEGLKGLQAGSNISDEKAFIDGNFGVNDYLTNVEGGYFKLANAPTLPITVVVEGYDFSSNGYLELKGEIIREVVTSRGTDPLTDPDDLDTSSFTQIDTDDPALHGIYVREPITIRDFVDRMIGPGFFWGYPFDSQKLTVGRWEGPSASADLVIPSHHILDGPEPLDNVLRAHRIILGFGRMRPHSVDEINADVRTSSSFLWGRAQENDGWSLAIAENPDVLDDHPFALETRFDSQYQYPSNEASILKPEGRDAAADESERLLGLYSSDWEAYRLVVDAVGLQLDLNDTVAPIVEQLDREGSLFYRLGFDGTRMMNVVAITFNVDLTVELIVVG